MKQWFSRDMKLKTFYRFCVFLLISYIACGIVGNLVEEDLFFMSATGREILNNGIPHTNVWSMDHSAEFVAQQWLHCVIIALLEPFGIWGLNLLVTVTILILSILIWKMMNIRGCDNRLVYGLTMAGVALTCVYFYSARPESITIILLLLEAYGLEKYRKTKKIGWLSLLPITMLLEINLHASMWIMHFGVLLIYMLPTPFSTIKADHMIKHWKPIGCFTLLSIGCMFINPYGVDSILYLFRSFLAGTFGYVPVMEVQSVTIFSVCITSILSIVSTFVILLATKKADSVTFYTGLFVIILEFASARNNMFHCIGLLYVATGLYNAYYQIKIFKLLRKKFIRTITTTLVEPSRMYRVFYLINMTKMHKNIAQQRFYRELIRKWRFISFTKKMARKKLELMYKNLHSSYLQMADEIFGDENSINPSVFKEFERFGTNVGMFRGQEPEIDEALNKKYYSIVDKKYVFTAKASMKLPSVKNIIKKEEYEEEIIEEQKKEDIKRAASQNIGDIKTKDIKKGGYASKYYYKK